MAFFHSISRKTHFRTVEFLLFENQTTLTECLQKIVRIYSARGFKVEYVCGNQQFQCLEEEFRPIHFNITALGEHVPEVERSIQTIKSDIRTLYHSMPYESLPPLIIKEMVENQVAMRNRFPSLNGVHKNISPLTMITGLPNPSYNRFKLEFGQYVQTHDHPQATNNMKTRTMPAIALGPSSSENGWYFMSLETGKRILRYKWTVLPVSQSTIDKVHELANQLKLKNENTNKPLFSENLTNYDKIILIDGDEVQTNSNIIQYKNNGEVNEEETTQASMEASNMTHAAIIRSESTVHQAQDEVTTSRPDQSDLENIEELELMASMNELNNFLDTPEFSYNTTTLEKDENNNIDGYVPYNDYREVDKDMFDDTKFYKDNNNYMDEDTEIKQNGEERSGNGGTIENNDPDKNLKTMHMKQNHRTA